MIALKALLILFIVAWTALGILLLVKYETIFGPHRDDPSESPGARSLGLAHIGSVWFGVFALAVYFLFAS